MDSIKLLQRLVQIPSPNPPGDTRAIADFVAGEMRAIGCQVRTPAPQAKPEARNAIATLGTGSPLIMLHAHIDTVPIAKMKPTNGMSIPTRLWSRTAPFMARAALMTKRHWRR